MARLVVSALLSAPVLACESENQACQQQLVDWDEAIEGSPAANEVVAMAQAVAENEHRVIWNTDYVVTGQESTPLSIAVTAANDRVPRKSRSGGLGCAWLEVPVDLTVQTEDGRLQETFRASLYRSFGANASITNTAMPPAALEGSLQTRGLNGREWLDFNLRFPDDGSPLGGGVDVWLLQRDITFWLGFIEHGPG